MEIEIKNRILAKKDEFPSMIIWHQLRLEYDESLVKSVLLKDFCFDVDIATQQELLCLEKYRYESFLRPTIMMARFKCEISDESNALALEVVHIVLLDKCPTIRAKTDPNNVLLLSTIIRKYFEAYALSIDPDTLMVEVKKGVLVPQHKTKVSLNNFEQVKPYLQHHYALFLGSQPDPVVLPFECHKLCSVEATCYPCWGRTYSTKSCWSPCACTDPKHKECHCNKHRRGCQTDDYFLKNPNCCVGCTHVIGMEYAVICGPAESSESWFKECPSMYEKTCGKPCTLVNEEKHCNHSTHHNCEEHGQFYCHWNNV